MRETPGVERLDDLSEKPDYWRCKCNVIWDWIVTKRHDGYHWSTPICSSCGQHHYQGVPVSAAELESIRRRRRDAAIGQRRLDDIITDSVRRVPV